MPAAAAVDTVTPAMSAIIVFFNDLNSFITKQSPLINSYLRIPKKTKDSIVLPTKKDEFVIHSSFFQPLPAYAQHSCVPLESASQNWSVPHLIQRKYSHYGVQRCFARLQVRVLIRPSREIVSFRHDKICQTAAEQQLQEWVRRHFRF